MVSEDLAIKFVNTCADNVMAAEGHSRAIDDVRAGLQAILPELVAEAVRAERLWFIEQVRKYSEHMHFIAPEFEEYVWKLGERVPGDERGLCYAEAVRRRMDSGPRVSDNE